MGQAERHHSAFTAPTPSAHAPAASAPTGPSSQSTICFPVDPKNVHTGPPTGSGRGPEAPGSNVEECSSMNQGGSTGHQYQYRPAQHQNHPPHTGVSQDCPAAPVYHAGPLTTIMSSVNQPTIQVYGAVVPQPPVTLMSSQNPHATTPHPSAPPPVPAPVPPVVPLSQPQPAATTTIVAMAPITVTVPINPGTHSSPQSVGSPTSQSGGASAQAVSGSTHSSVALPPLSTAFVSGMSQPGIAPTQVTSVLSDMSQPMVTPAQVTTPMVSGIPQHSVTLTQVSSSISTGMSQTPIASPLATPFVSGMSQPTIAPTKVTAAVISGIPQTAIAPSSVTVSAVPTSSQLGGTQTSVATAKLTEKSQVTVIPAQVTTGSVSCVPQSAVPPGQVLTAVVTGVPKSVTSVSHGITSGITEIPQRGPSPDVVDISDEKQSDKVDTQSPSAIVPGLQQYAKDDNVDRGSKGTPLEYSNASNFGISQAAKIATRGSTAVVSGVPKTVVEITKTATAIVSGVPKSSMGSAQAQTAVVSGVPKTQVMHTQVSSCSVTGVSKPLTLTAQSNTAVVSGVPRMSVAPTQLTSTVVPSASHLLKQVTSTAISEKSRSIGLPLKDTRPVDHEIHQHNVSPSKISSEVPRISKHTKIPNLGSVCTSEESEKTGCASTPKMASETEVQVNTTDAINSVPESYVACKGTANKPEAKVTEGVRTTCPVSPMNASGIEMKDVTKVKKENEVQPSIIRETDISKSVNTAHPMFTIPDFPNRVSRPNTSWSPTQHSITTEKETYKQFSTPVNHSSSSGCDIQHSHSVGKMSLSSLSCSTNISASNQVLASDSARSPASGVPLTFQSKNACPNNTNITSINASAASAVVPSTLSNSKSKEEGISPLKEKSKANTTCNVATKAVDDAGRTGLQRPGTRHLLCQTLPSLTKTATASVAKAKSSSSTNTHRMLVKSEDKSKDTKPNIPESVPSSQSNPSPNNSSSSTITINTAKIEECGNVIDVKADIVRAEPIVRKRGRPPKVRDSSSDSSSNAPSETSSPSHHSGYRSPKMKPDVNTTPEKKNSSLHDPDMKKSRNSLHPFLGTKTLRSHSEERKKSLLQTSTVPTSPSKQVDCKQDIKSGGSMKMINIKTEVFPKIKTEKVSPKGVNKNLSPLKVSPKEISLFKNKIENGQDETSLKSSDLSRKCELSSPTKIDEFTDSKKYIKGAKEIKKSPSGLLSDQRVPKNNVVISKSKLKDDEKKVISSNTSLKRKSSESIGSSSKVITKSRESETSSKAAGGAKHQAQKFQKISKSTKGSTRRSCPNGKVNRKKSLLAYLKERNNESDTSSVDSEAAGGGRRRSKSKEESPKSNSASPFPSAFPPQPVNSGSRRRSATGHGKSKSTKKPRWVHNWSWEGEPFEGKIWLRNDELPLVRTCYSAMRHKEGDIVRVRDCVLLRSGPKKTDLPFVAKIAALWEDPETSDMMMSILWYYRPEHTESGRREEDLPDEIFASKHRDHLSVACIEDRCYVLTFNEYCRYRRFLRLFQEGVYPITTPVPDPEEGYSRKDRQPPGCVVGELLFFCRRVYDYRQKRLLKNPY